MRLVSAAIGTSFPFSPFENFGVFWFLYASDPKIQPSYLNVVLSSYPEVT
jgi:hypothetical protein